jgi:putative phage-type endonuclease
MDQGSLAWHEYRANPALRSASEAAIIMDCAPKYWQTSKRILWEQKQGLRGSNVDPSNPAIMRGNRLEPKARACFNHSFGVQTEPVVGLEGDYSASLDGHGIDKQGQSIKVEIKCPMSENSEVWKLAAKGEIAPYYHWQMVHQSLVVPTEQTFFYVYLSDNQRITIPHIASESDIQALKDAWDEFYASEPEPDWEDRTDDDMRILVERHRDLVQQKAILDVELKLAEKALKTEAGDGNVMAFGARIQTIEKKGSVDYKTVPQLEGIDLEAYRKPGSSYKKITHAKES